MSVPAHRVVPARRPRRRALVALLLTPVLAFSGAAAATAGTTPAGSAAESLAFANQPVVAPAAAVPGADYVETDRRSRPVAPGVTLHSYDRLDPTSWQRADALTVDLTAGATVDYLSPGAVASAAPVSAQATRQRAVAAINGDFFDINRSNAPLGPAVDDGKLVKSPSGTGDVTNAVGFDAQGIGRVLQVMVEGTVTLPGGQATTLAQLNSPVIPADGIGAYTPLWGTHTRAVAVEGAARVTEVVVSGGAVAAVRDAAGDGPIPTGSFVLVGREAGSDTLRGLQVGDAVSLSYRPKTSDGSTLATAVGGRQVLISDGAVVAPDDVRHPRTAVGFSADGKRLFILTVDGRQPQFAGGVTLKELATLMKELGAHNALNLDGGGSSTMVTREPGATDVQVENSPSDGAERPVPNGLALYAPAGSGRLTGFWVETAADPQRAPGASAVQLARPDRVFPGLTRRLTARGHDETYGPAAGTPRWRVDPDDAGTVDDGGVFQAREPGTATVTASGGHAKGQVTLTVLNALDRLSGTTDQVGLVNAGDTATFGIVGTDAGGFAAPIEPADVRLSYDRNLVDVIPTADGTFAVTAKAASGATLVTATVAGRSTVVPVTVGLADHPAATFDDAASWTFTTARATGSASPAPGHTGNGLKMTYDFTQSTATRAAYANPPAWVEVPGAPRAFSMWLHGSGHGEWPSLHLVDARGTDHVLRGPLVTWQGWRQFEMAVPAGVAYPVKIRRFYVAETRPDALYHSEIVIDDIVAKVPPPVDVPPVAVVPDPVIAPAGGAAGSPWRFAVMSDAQFVAREPDSDLVAKARRTLREIKAAHPDFVVVNGDLVDEGSPEDLALARRILTEELGDSGQDGAVPWYYVPGNHEVMGGAIDNFTREFGPAYRSFDHRGTRFVSLDTSRLTVRGGGLDQVRLLRRALDTAARDRSVRSVVLLQHVPPRDPAPGSPSQLTDRKEAALVEQWLADFQRATGKGAAFIGAHTGAFHASRVDGVPYVINGNSGKAPSAPADAGGFTGWTLFGVDTARLGTPWLAAEVRPHVDAITLTAPTSVPVGQSVPVAAAITQSGRQVPAAYPVSVSWSGSPNLHIGAVRDARPWHVAVFDPSTGRLTALRQGDVTLAVTVAGVRQTTTVRVAARAAA